MLLGCPVVCRIDVANLFTSVDLLELVSGEDSLLYEVLSLPDIALCRSVSSCVEGLLSEYVNDVVSAICEVFTIEDNLVRIESDDNLITVTINSVDCEGNGNVSRNCIINGKDC